MAVQTPPAIKISFDDYLRDYAHKRYEYVDGYARPLGQEITGPDGEIIVAPTRLGHGKITGRLHTLIGAYVMEHHLGEVLGAETGFLMRSDPPEMRAADIAFITAKRARQEQDEGWLSAPPDLAVEVISEYDSAAEVRIKAEAYMAYGTRMLLVVYPRNRVIDVYQPGQPVQTLTEQDALEGGDILPGFSVPLTTIFTE
jgi:Uma2 family endonuclease